MQNVYALLRALACWLRQHRWRLQHWLLHNCLLRALAGLHRRLCLHRHHSAKANARHKAGGASRRVEPQGALVYAIRCCANEKLGRATLIDMYIT